MKRPHIVVGREKDLEAIKMQFDVLLEGCWALAVIAGETGIGKTTLVKKAMADLSLVNGTCVYGKFDQYNGNQPYVTIIQILEQITGHLLTLPEDKLGRVRTKLVQNLGLDRILLTGMVPQIRGILGHQKDVQFHDVPQLKVRLQKAIQTFIAVAARELYPLVMAVDDLQWADPLSWEILKALYDPLNDHPFYLILVYKNEREEYREKVAAMLADLAGNEPVREIQPKPLSAQDIAKMLASAFDGHFDNFQELVQLVYRKTAGNPLYIHQMLKLFLENKGIDYDPDTKVWRLVRDKAQSLHLPDTVADLISSKIDDLSPDAKELLEIAACVGDRFTSRVLSIITHHPIDDVEEQLRKLCRLGFLIETREGYEFFHNRIHQNAYEQIEPCRQEELHYRIAMTLLQSQKQTGWESNLLSIGSHLLRCQEVIKREGTGSQLTFCLYQAGMMAKQSAAVEHALKLFSLAEELLGEFSWQKDYDHTLRIKLERAECLFICGRYEEAETCFMEMLRHAACERDLAAIKKRYMLLYSYSGHAERVIDLGFQTLAHLGCRLSTHHLKFQLMKEILLGHFLFRDSRLAAIQNAPLVTDERLANVLEILTVMAASASMVDEHLFLLIVLKIGNLSAQYGNSPYAPLGYAAYSILWGSVFGDYRKGEKLQNIALSLVEQDDGGRFAATTYFCIGSFIAHWTAPAAESYAYLQKAFQVAMDCGDYLYSGYAIMIMLEMKHSMGAPLSELEELLGLPEKYPRELSNDLLRRSIALFQEHIARMSFKGSFPEAEPVEGQEMELKPNEVMIYHLLKIQWLYLEGEIDQAFRLLRKYISRLDSTRGYIIQVDWVFYYLLVSLEKMRDRKHSAFQLYDRAFRRYRRKLRVWAELSPANHRAKHLLIEGLVQEQNNRLHDAIELYESAIEQAKKTNNLFLQALGNSLAAAFFRENPKLAQVYAAEACRLFRRWGAERAAHRIGQLYGIEDDAVTIEAISLAGDISPENVREKVFTSFLERLPDYQRELLSLELGSAYQYFLNVVCRETGVDVGSILLERDDRLKLEYSWEKNGGVMSHRPAPDLEQVDFLPKKVLRYVGRTYQPVVIPAKPGEGPFAGDDYIQARTEISILCLPLKYNNIFVGLVYLESGHKHRFDTVLVEALARLSFYLVVKEVLERNTKHPTPARSGLHVQLTEQEREVLQYMAKGLSNKEIAEKMSISSSTVKTYTLNLYSKLGVNSRVQVVMKAREFDLV